MKAQQTLSSIWQATGLPVEALNLIQLTGSDPVFSSSFAVGTAAQASIAAAALAACEVGHQRGTPRQKVAVDMLHAAQECSGWFSLNGVAPDIWDKFSGIYRCADGWVRIHANFAHHREGTLKLLGLDASVADRADAERAILDWRAIDFETVSANAGMVAAALRSFDEWDATEQGRAVAAQPLFTIKRIGDAPPLALPVLSMQHRPLAGVRVLDLTRILAGPVAGRALAAYGADVMLINSPNLPNIAAIADTSRGKRSAHADLRTARGQAALNGLLSDAHVFIQGYRPGGLQNLGFGPLDAIKKRPGLVYASLSAYGPKGPWAARRGFDSLLQTAMGFNHAEGQAAGDGKPRALPMQILDQASAYVMATGAAAALWHQQHEGGSWHVEVSLTQTAHWLRSLGRVPSGLHTNKPDLKPFLERSDSGFGELLAVRPSAQLERTPAGYELVSVLPGFSLAEW